MHNKRCRIENGDTRHGEHVKSTLVYYVPYAIDWDD